MLVIGLVAIAVAIGAWILRPLDQAAKSSVRAPQFTLVDFLCLFVLIQLPTGLIHGWLRGTDYPGIWVLDGFGWGSCGMMWWISVRTLSRAGIQNPWHRGTFLLSALPLAFFGSIATPFIVLLLVVSAATNTPAELKEMGWLAVAVVALVAALYGCGRYTRWMIRAAHPPMAGAAATAGWHRLNSGGEVQDSMGLSELQRRAIDRVIEYLNASRSLLFITGAGISADSGLPTYRGIGGLYNVDVTEDGMPIEVALSGHTLRTRPEVAWKYLAQIGRAVMGAKHNRGHEVIAEMEARFDRVLTLTQNVDGFHRQAGSKNVIEIHGNMHELVCTACGFSRGVGELDETEIPPRCPECQALLRPDVVLFGELLPEEKTRRLYHELAIGFDLVFTIGTTSVFPYIAEPVWHAKHRGVPTVEINPGSSEVSHLVNVKLAMGAAAALDAIWQRYQSRVG